MIWNKPPIPRQHTRGDGQVIPWIKECLSVSARPLRPFPFIIPWNPAISYLFLGGEWPDFLGYFGGSKMKTSTVGENRSAARFATLNSPPTARFEPPPIRTRVDHMAASRHGRLNTISRRLFKAFPRVFKYPPVPLAIAIGPKRCELMGPEFKPAEVRAFLHAWTSGPRYLKAVLRGERRRNLDGSPTGVPEPEHRAAAKEQLKAIGHSTARSDPRSK